MANLEEYELLGTQLEDVAIRHAIEGCNAYQTLYTSYKTKLLDPTVADAMKWIEEHEKEHHPCRRTNAEPDNG